ncbi:MAG: preprotein translocase subunit YajC [Pirellulales bacterium]|nr:preprotein translocase subunit YajC [Pirellulales bacterium]
MNLLFWTDALLVAQAAGGGAAPQNPQGSLLSLALPFLMIGLVFYFLMVRPQKREQQTRSQMLAALKKNDRVVTVGGIYGVVASVQADSDEVTLKIDENTNTKLRVTLSSIARILGDEPDADKSSKAN